MYERHSGHTVPPPDPAHGLGCIVPIASGRGRIRSRESPLFTGLFVDSCGTASCSSSFGLSAPPAALVGAEVGNVRQV